MSFYDDSTFKEFLQMLEREIDVGSMSANQRDRFINDILRTQRVRNPYDRRSFSERYMDGDLDEYTRSVYEDPWVNPFSKWSHSTEESSTDWRNDRFSITFNPRSADGTSWYRVLDRETGIYLDVALSAVEDEIGGYKIGSPHRTFHRSATKRRAGLLAKAIIEAQNKENQRAQERPNSGPLKILPSSILDDGQPDFLSPAP